MIPKTAYSILLKLRTGLSFGCPLIDEAIGKFESSSGITEISGEAGTGKTQFCLSLSLQCQLPIACGGIEGSCAYISCGEGEFPIRRLSQLASAFESKFNIPQSKLLEGIFIENCYSPEDVYSTLQKKLPEMCASKNIKLLVLDSLAGAVRTEFDARDKGDMIDRTKYLFKLAQLLKWLADTFELCVIVVNQVHLCRASRINYTSHFE
jgi:RecA/RadA recombinase